MKITIDDKELNEEDVHTLKLACDLYARLMMGQFSELGNHFKIALTNPPNGVQPKKPQLIAVCKLLEDAQRILHGNTSCSWGICDPQVSPQARQALRVEKILAGDLEAVEALQKLICQTHTTACFGGFNPISDGTG